MTPDTLERHLLDAIPLARAMALRVAGYDGVELRLTAPLSPNRNDKGCAFGGSLASLMTLAGWGVAALRLDRQGEDAEIYVQDSTIRYLAPVWEDLSIAAWIEVDDGGAAFIAGYAARGRARANIRAECRLSDGVVAASLQARFVAIDPARNTKSR